MANAFDSRNFIPIKRQTSFQPIFEDNVFNQAVARCQDSTLNGTHRSHPSPLTLDSSYQSKGKIELI